MFERATASVKMLGSEGLHTTTRRRAERQTSSCTECRRRKQKCSQGQPCTNCVRRFPQPICEYKTKSPRRNPPTGNNKPELSIPHNGVTTGVNPTAIRDVDIQLQDGSKLVNGGSMAAHSLSFSSSNLGGLSQMSNLRDKGATLVSLKSIGEHSSDSDEKLEDLRLVFERRLTIANHMPRNQWLAEEDRLHWLSRQTKPPSSPPARPIEGALQQLRFLPMMPTKLNKELVRIHLELLCRFKVSLDGNPDPNNVFMRHWVPCCVQDPLLLQIVLFTSACFFSETGHIPKALAIVYKGKVYQMLNQRLREEDSQTSDTSILGVLQMVVDSWYWGATTDLHAHLAGLKQMIHLRGGLQELGLHGFLSKAIIIHDVVMAFAHEVEPSIYGVPGFDFMDSIMMPFHTALNSPLISGWPTFAGCMSSLQLHPNTASILDHMRSLIDSVLMLPEDASTSDLQNVVAAAAWIQQRVSQMPEDTPTYEPPESHSSRQSNDSSQRATSPDSTRSSASRSTTSKRSTPPQELPDLMYRTVRLTALVYCRAILNRSPTSEVCTETEFLMIWKAVWGVGLPGWKTTVGIFVWVMLAIVPSSHFTGHARFVKTLMVAGFMNVAMDNWHIAMDITQNALKLQRWLSQGGWGNEGDRGLSGGESVVDKHGFAFKEYLPDIDLPIDEE